MFVVSRTRTHILYHFIPIAMHVICMWSDLQNDLGTKDIDAYLTESEKWPGGLRKGAAGGLNVPSAIPPAPIILRIESIRDFLIDSDHDVCLVCSKTEDRE